MGWRSASAGATNSLTRGVLPLSRVSGTGGTARTLRGRTLLPDAAKSSGSLRPSERRPLGQIELSAGELEKAEEHRADRKVRYRILYIENALDLGEARPHALPTLERPAGQRFYSNVQRSGIRLRVPLA